jgi:hypothetical protein
MFKKWNERRKLCKLVEMYNARLPSGRRAPELVLKTVNENTLTGTSMFSIDVVNFIQKALHNAQVTNTVTEAHIALEKQTKRWFFRPAADAGHWNVFIYHFKYHVVELFVSLD